MGENFVSKNVRIWKSFSFFNLCEEGNELSRISSTVQHFAKKSDLCDKLISMYHNLSQFAF